MGVGRPRINSTTKEKSGTAKDKKPEEKISLNWNKLFEEEEMLKNDLGDVKLYENKLSEKKMSNKMPKRTEVMKKENNDLFGGKISQDKQTKTTFGEKILKIKVFEELKYKLNMKVKNGMVVTKGTSNNKLKKPSWRRRRFREEKSQRTRYHPK